MANRRHLLHVKSNVTTTTTVDEQTVTLPKLPLANDMEYGEIAINYHDGYETISIKNDNSEIVTFPNTNSVSTMISEAMESVQDELTFDETPTANSENPVTSEGIKSYVDDAVTIQTITSYDESTPLAVGDTHDEALSKLSKIIEDNEFAVSMALNDLDSRKQDSLTLDDTPTANSENAVTSDGIKTYVDEAVTIQSIINYADSTPLAVGDTHDEALSKLNRIIEDDELTISRALSDLEETKQDVLEFDELPTQNSDNMLTSGAIYDALASQEDKYAEIQYSAIDPSTDELTVSAISLHGCDNIGDAEYVWVTQAGGVGLGTGIGGTNTNVSDKFYKVKDKLSRNGLNISNTYTYLSGIHQLKYQSCGFPLTDDGTNGTWYLKGIEDDLELELNTKQDTLTFDSAPTSSSTNPVTSGGLYTTLQSYATSVNYDSNTKKIYLKNGDTVLSEVDAADFIKDGMVSGVRIGTLDDEEISDGSDSDFEEYLIITFNTDAGQEDIVIPISEIFNSDLYYTKEEIGEKEAVAARALIDLEERKQEKPLIVNFTATYYCRQENFSPRPGMISFQTVSGVDCTCDTSYEDIVAAIEADRQVIGIVTYDTTSDFDSTLHGAPRIWNLDDKVFPFVYVGSDITSEGFIEFTGLSNTPYSTNISTFTLIRIEIGNDESVSWREQNVGDIQMDTTPTANSTNAVTSGGIKTYVDNATKVQAITTYNVATPVAVNDTHDQAISKLIKLTNDAGSVQTITTYSESTPIEVGDTHDEAFSKLIKIINDNEYITATALSELDAAVDELQANAEQPDAGQIVETTYSDLVDAVANEELVPGTWYRITDYITTTTQTNTQSANHAFDVIVLALDVNKLSADAKAIAHEGSNYFNNANLEAWELKYCLDNNKTRFAWADIQDGTGVIYYMKDEWGNECPYDFKNIMFKRKLTDGQLDATNGSDTWVYTFNVIIGNGAATDNSLGLNLSLLGGSGIITLCADNIIKPCYDYNNINNVVGGSGEYVLNDTVFLGYAATVAGVADLYTAGNEFGICARDNTFGYATYANKFGDYCENNTFAYYCYRNRIGNNFTANQISNSFIANIIGNLCANNEFGSFIEYNTIGNNCQYNTFSTNSMAIDDEDSMVTNNTFGNNMSHCTFSSIGSCSIGNFVRWVVMDDHKYSKFAIENNVSYVRFTCSASQTYDHICQNFKICEGVQGTSFSSLKTITHTTVDDTFLTEYKPINSQVISV